MARIGEFLNKFKLVLDSEESKKEVIVRIIKKLTGKEIKIDDLSIKNSFLIIKTNPYLKSEILLNKNSLLNEIKKESLDLNIKDIK